MGNRGWLTVGNTLGLMTAQWEPTFIKFMCVLTENETQATVGNLHSFSDNGNFSPQILVQSTYIFLKCSENYFGKFWAPALMALWPLALQPLWPCWNFACFPGGQKNFCTQNFIKIHSKMTELQPVIHFCYVILFNNFARPLRLIKAMQSQMVLTCFIFWPNQLN